MSEKKTVWFVTGYNVETNSKRAGYILFPKKMQGIML